MRFNNFHVIDKISRRGRLAFTMVETVIAIALIGIGVSTTIAALTKFNAFASESRNATGAYAACINQIDAIQSATPFKPPTLVPTVLTLGTQAPEDVNIYQDANSNRVVAGTRTTTVADVSTGGVTIYRATVTVNYTYLGRSYSFSMQTLRSSD